MKKRRMFGLLFVLSLFFALPANASLPGPETTDFSKAFDVSSVPDSLYIWNSLTKGSASQAERIYMVCQSESDTSGGACPVAAQGRTSNSGQIRLKFVQDITKAALDVIVTNVRSHGGYSSAVWSPVTIIANDEAPKFSYYITKSELGKLTAGEVVDDFSGFQ